jgi:hypothetical protein
MPGTAADISTAISQTLPWLARPAIGYSEFADIQHPSTTSFITSYSQHYSLDCRMLYRLRINRQAFLNTLLIE